jgi:hypothetical protein
MAQTGTGKKKKNFTSTEFLHNSVCPPSTPRHGTVIPPPQDISLLFVISPLPPSQSAVFYPAPNQTHPAEGKVRILFIPSYFLLPACSSPLPTSVLLPDTVNRYNLHCESKLVGQSARNAAFRIMGTLHVYDKNLGWRMKMTALWDIASVP